MGVDTDTPQRQCEGITTHNGLLLRVEYTLASEDMNKYKIPQATSPNRGTNKGTRGDSEQHAESLH